MRIGFAAGWLGSWLGENRLSGGSPLDAIFDPRLFATVLVLTPVLSVLIGWLPAIWAAELDPAESLGRAVQPKKEWPQKVGWDRHSEPHQ